MKAWISKNFASGDERTIGGDLGCVRAHGFVFLPDIRAAVDLGHDVLVGGDHRHQAVLRIEPLHRLGVTGRTEPPDTLRDPALTHRAPQHT